jgi:hypothetical protein
MGGRALELVNFTDVVFAGAGWVALGCGQCLPRAGGQVTLSVKTGEVGR